LSSKLIITFQNKPVLIAVTSLPAASFFFEVKLNCSNVRAVLLAAISDDLLSPAAA
jgi:hypothetical protein